MLRIVFFLLLPFFLIAQQTSGLFHNTPAAYNGYTLFSNNHQTFLIDNCGFIVNEWEANFRPGRSVYLLENGDLLRPAQIDGNFTAGGYGGRFEIYDWDNNLKWRYDYLGEKHQAHHDVAPLPNGNFLAIAWELKSEAEAQAAGRIYAGDMWSERLVEVKPIGTNQVEIVWEWHLWDHLVQDQKPNAANYKNNISDHPELVNINYIGEGHETSGNWIHLNAIAYNAELDQIAVSSRFLSEIWIIDHSTTTAEAASHSGGQSGKGGDLLYRYGNPQVYDRGTVADQIFFGQHDVHWIPSDYPQGGKLMVFNNFYQGNEQQSSIEIWQPPVQADGSYLLTENSPFAPAITDWTYTTTSLFSDIMSSAEVLPNGNLFICEGRSGEFTEVTPVGERVWRYINPVNHNGFAAAQGGQVRFNLTFQAKRYPVDYQAFAGRPLVATVPVERNPIESDCEIYETSVAIDNTLSKPEFRIIGNPISDLLKIEMTDSSKFKKLYLYNSNGEKVATSFTSEMEITPLSSGIYFLKIETIDGRFFNQKIIKI